MNIYDYKNHLTIGCQELINNIKDKKSIPSENLSLFLALTDAEKKKIWRFFIDTQSSFFSDSHVIEMFKSQLCSIEKELDFFNQYICPFERKSYITIELNWFVKHSSNFWMLEFENINNENNEQLFKKIFDFISITPDGPSYKKVTSSLINKINQLETEQLNYFIKYYIEPLELNKRHDFIKIIFSYGDERLVNFIYGLYKDEFDSDLKGKIGWSLFARQKNDFVLDYKELILFSLQNHLPSKKDALYVGNNMSVAKLKLYYDLYDKLDVTHRDSFPQYMIYQVLMDHKSNSGRNTEIIKTYLDIRKNNPYKVPVNNLIFLVWRIAHTFPKELANDIFTEILNNAKCTSDLDFVKDKLSDSSKTFVFNNYSMDMNNSSLKSFLKNYLYTDLNKNLIKKDVKKNKMKL